MRCNVAQQRNGPPRREKRKSGSAGKDRDQGGCEERDRFGSQPSGTALPSLLVGIGWVGMSTASDSRVPQQLAGSQHPFRVSRRGPGGGTVRFIVVVLCHVVWERRRQTVQLIGSSCGRPWNRCVKVIVRVTHIQTALDDLRVGDCVSSSRTRLTPRVWAEPHLAVARQAAVSIPKRARPDQRMTLLVVAVSSPPPHQPS